MQKCFEKVAVYETFCLFSSHKVKYRTSGKVSYVERRFSATTSVLQVLSSSHSLVSTRPTSLSLPISLSSRQEKRKRRKTHFIGKLSYFCLEIVLDISCLYVRSVKLRHLDHGMEVGLCFSLRRPNHMVAAVYEAIYFSSSAV